MSEKVCVSCEYSHQALLYCGETRFYCHRNAKQIIDIVTGKYKWFYVKECRNERECYPDDETKCGRFGRFYVGKDPFKNTNTQPKDE